MPDNTKYVCLHKDCLKEVGQKELELVFLHCGINNKASESEISNLVTSYTVSSTLQDNTNLFTVYSIWRTTMNTMYVKTTNDADIKTNSVIANILGVLVAYFVVKIYLLFKSKGT